MEIQKMSKAELFKEMKRLAEKTKATKDAAVQYRYKQRYKMARRHFYECRLCADALTETYIGARGEEKERFIRDCGLADCPYRNYFEDLANGIVDETTRFIDRLNRCLDGEG